MECQVEKKEHFRHLLLFAFNHDGEDAKATKAAREICAVYGEDAMPERMARWWFSRFKNKKFKLKYAVRYCHIRYVRTSIVVLQKNAITSIRSHLMNRFVESMHL